MIIDIVLFAAVRDRIGNPRLRLELPDRYTLRQLKERLQSDYPAAASILSVCRFAVNSEYGTPDQPLSDGCEVGVIPPVSGGADSPLARERILHAKIVRTRVDLNALSTKVSSADCGATLTFAGTVRADKEKGRAVIRITYEGYEGMAEKTLRQIAQQAAGAYDASVAVEHRLGCLNIGEISIGIAISTPHREDGFGALREIIESVKKELPIWKKEEFSDGTAEWVNCRH